jgi:hypothetical protein
MFCREIMKGQATLSKVIRENGTKTVVVCRWRAAARGVKAVSTTSLDWESAKR